MTGSAVSVTGFALLALSAVLLEVSARRHRLGRRREPPEPASVTAAAAITAAMRTAAGRATVFAAWLWLGVHFLAR